MGRYISRILPNGIPQNEGSGTPFNSHGQNGNVGTPGHIELDGLGGDTHLGNGEAMETDQVDRLPCGKPKTSY